MITFLKFTFPFAKDIIGFLLWIDSIGYQIFSALFRLFINLAQYEIFEHEAFKSLYDNIYIIVGVIALFVISFMLLQMVINPDENKGSKQIRDILLRFITSIAAIVLLPTFFSFLMDFQNVLISYGVVPKVVLNTDFNIQYYDDDGNLIQDQAKFELEKKELTAMYMEGAANEMAASVMGGLMYPLNEDGTYIKPIFDENKGYTAYYTNEGEEWFTKVSEWWTVDKKINWAAIACGAAIVAGAAVTIVSYGSAAAFSGGLAAAVCLGGAAVVLVSGEVIAEISADSYTWTNAMQAAEMGDFTKITLFAKAVQEGNMHYTAIISTVAIGYLIYIMLGFCIDVIVRSAKLFFYQLLGPLCFLMSVIPSKKDLLMSWLKKVMSIWLELFVRVVAVCLIILLVGKMNFDNIVNLMHPIASAFILLGFVTFVKQIPTLFKDITGIDSGNMKLGIKDKFRDAFNGIPGAAAVGTLAKKTISGLDAKRNGQNFADGWRRIEGKGPIANAKKWFNGMLPYSAANAESRRKADEQRKALSSKVEKGQDELEKLRGILGTDEYKDVLAKRDSNGEYIKDKDGNILYKDVNEADSGDYIRYLDKLDHEKYGDLFEKYQNRGKAKKNMLRAKAELEAAQQSGDASIISAAAKKYNEYKDSYEAFDQEWKQEIGSSKFKHENEVFSSMKYIEDRNKGLVSEPENGGYQATRNPQPIASNVPPKKTKIEIVSSSGNGPRQENSHSNQNINDTYSQLVKQFDDAKTPEEKNKIRKQIDEFERKH